MNEKILVVDDEQEIGELVGLYLKNEGYTVFSCTLGAEALACVEREELSLAILDVMLPDMTGFDLFRRIRETHMFPIVMLTAKVEDMDKITGLTLGADDYMTKPFNPLELVARVKAHIGIHARLGQREQGSRQEECLAFGDLKIYPKAYRVFLKDKEIALANREFELLLFLASNPNIVFSKETLFERIWGMDALGDSATVMVHVNRIREKLKDPSDDREYIQTVWGAGYRFCAE